MGNLVLNGSTSGQITVSPAAVSGTNTITLPAITDTMVGLAATQTLTNKTLTSPTITGAVVSAMASSVITSGTVNAGGTNPFPVSGGPTSVDFTSIPSWAKRVTVMFTGVSTSGTSEVIFRVGTSGGIQSTGYLSTSSVVSTGVSATNDTTGFRIYNAGGAATDLRNGALTLSLLDSATGTWSATAIFGQSDAARNNFIGGSKALSGTLDRVRITTVGGTDTFDAGSINILYE